MNVVWWSVLYLAVGLATLVITAVADRIVRAGPPTGDKEFLVAVFLWPVVWIFVLFDVAAFLLKKLYSLVRGSTR